MSSNDDINLDIPLPCPFCQQHNQCGVNNPADCWCMQQTVPPELLRLLPVTAQNKQCICASCIRSFTQNPQLFSEQYRILK